MRYLWCCVLLWPGLAAAEIYRWTDAQGQVHFDQRPAAGAEQIVVKPQVVERDAATREREARTEKFYEARRQEQERASTQAAERQDKREQECRELRNRLAQLADGGRYYSTDAQGQRVYYSDTQIDAARRQLTDRVADRCG